MKQNKRDKGTQKEISSEEEHDNFIDLILSDVHMLQPRPDTYDPTHNTPCVHLSRFPLLHVVQHLLDEDAPGTNMEVEYDSDGDIIPPRKYHLADTSLIMTIFVVDPNLSVNTEVVSISHRLATPLKEVGFQVWRGALVLADYLVHHSRDALLNSCNALELGAGMGLCGIVLARVAERVFITDYDDGILENCLYNVDLNKYLFQRQYQLADEKSRNTEVVKVRKLDWTDETTWPCNGENRENTNKGGEGGKFIWSEEDIKEFGNVRLIIASDVIYDDDYTDAFFNVLRSLLQEDRVLILSLEKRINFSLDDLEVAAPAYNYFRQQFVVDDTQSCDIGHFVDMEGTQTGYFHGKQLTINFPQYFSYERVSQLELWEIKLNNK